MADPNYARVRDIYHKVAELPIDQRSSVVLELCQGDEELRLEVEQLLEATDGDTAGDWEPHNTASETPEIPDYTILRVLGEGGMGTVFEAEQAQPLRRVALKVIRAGFVTPSLLRRFRREAELLGRLNHPSIAQIYEVGLGHSGGRETPFISMELIEGLPILEYAARLPTRARLKLAAQVCDAVEHAHQRGVIHRDLKPGNVLVDSSGRPKVLDFGVARASNSDLRATTMRTEAGQILGTAAYMSPEQASGDHDALDTRSDVYALGVLTFELLTGRLPHRLDGLLLPDAIRVIREDEPSRIGSLDTSLRGDVDTILARALEREKDRRYGSAAALAEDIRRYLRDEPILARPPSTVYQLRKFARRNRPLVIGAAAVFLALVLGLAATGVALARESAALAEAERALSRAEASVGFLDQVLLGLAPGVTQGRDTELLEAMLDQARSDLNEDSLPVEVRAEMRHIIGRALHAIFRYEDAIAELERVEAAYIAMDPPRDADLDDARLLIADAQIQLGQFEAGEVILKGIIERTKTRSDDGRTLSAYRQLAELQMDRGEAELALETIDLAGAIQDAGAEGDSGRVRMLRGAILRRLNRPADAQAEYEAALQEFSSLGLDIEASKILNSLAILARADRRVEDAERLFREAVQLRTAADPRPSQDIASVLSNLGRLLAAQDRLEEAAEILERSISMHEELYGPDHYSVGFPVSSLGQVTSKLGDHDQALAMLDRAMRLLSSQFGDAHPVVATTLYEQGEALRRAARYEESVEVFRKGIDLASRLGLPPGYFEYPMRRGLGESLASLGQTDHALKELETALVLAPADSPAEAQIREMILELETQLQGDGATGAPSSESGSSP